MSTNLILRIDIFPPQARVSATITVFPDGSSFNIIYIDLPGCVTEGDTLEAAFDMARDAVGIYLAELETDGVKDFPAASDPVDLHPAGKGFVALVDMDMLAYKQKHDNRAVKKTLSIPRWLNTLAKREGVNFSNILQAALKKHLRV